MDTVREAAHRGLLKLMLRLPAVRGQLQILWRTDTSLEALCEAYEAATTTFERLTRKSSAGEDGLVEEYRNVCLELEKDVQTRCLAGVGQTR
ncbi:hypothetical protein [Rhizobium leguminosarum]|uniref:hypothetical protein n=1 Tax=Rhizobium leguminosarum TaxID=384 RepID=UPI00103ED239|nr:hypothetical protein [Rhizobium leguminosarum]TBY80605.1 hypothetical protein E0H32_19555 [Rhizobium leguminosarum bv. viciae]TBZ14646.1 hypothetical protein E0H33_15080 [Rhizobium leguminosarum bv. viciae]